MSAVIKALPASRAVLVPYFGSVAKTAVVCVKMADLGWVWVESGSFVGWQEGPTFAYRGGNDRARFNIKPWKKSDGTYVWRCHHPAFKNGDELMEFIDPVSCAVAQEVQGE